MRDEFGNRDPNYEIVDEIAEAGGAEIKSLTKKAGEIVTSR
jgi:hypothetical protein